MTILAFCSENSLGVTPLGVAATAEAVTPNSAFSFILDAPEGHGLLSRK